MSAAVESRDLEKIFQDRQRGEVRAVDGVSFACEAGEIFGLLGPNGAGKTTTLRILATILKPTRGTASVMGHDILEAPEQARASIGFHTGNTALYPKLTPRETLDFFARINHYPKERIEQRVRDLIEIFHMKEFADARCEKLSTGMKQKVSIARTVAHDPPVLVFDEPTVGLDVIAALEMHTFIRDLRAQGKCIIFSTHVMSEAEKLCDRIGIIHNGRILAVGSLEDLRRLTGKHYLEDIFVHLVRPGGE
jgi:sodium transport system ATP-binding protein